MQRYKSNPAAAQAELSDRLIEVTGMVARHFDAKIPPVVVLGVTGSKATVTCILFDELRQHQRNVQLPRDRLQLRFRRRLGSFLQF